MKWTTTTEQFPTHFMVNDSKRVSVTTILGVEVTRIQRYEHAGDRPNPVNGTYRRPAWRTTCYQTGGKTFTYLSSVRDYILSR